MAEIRYPDLRHTGATIAAQAGSTLKKLMNRIGHSTARAAINYQRASNNRDHRIAAALDKMIEKEQGRRKAATRRAPRKPVED